MWTGGDFDYNGSVDVADLGILASNWQVFGGYTYLDAEIVKASVLDNTKGKVPANTPKNSFSMWTTYPLTAVASALACPGQG